MARTLGLGLIKEVTFLTSLVLQNFLKASDASCARVMVMLQAPVEILALGFAWKFDAQSQTDSTFYCT